MVTLENRSAPATVTSSPPQDLRICHEVDDLLRAYPYHALRRVSCECFEGQLILLGRVPTYFLKQMAQSLTAKVAGIKKIDNRVEVGL